MILFMAKDGILSVCSSDPPPTTYLLNQIPLVDTHMDDRHGEFRPDHLNRHFYSSIFSEAKCYSDFSVMMGSFILLWMQDEEETSTDISDFSEFRIHRANLSSIFLSFSIQTTKKVDGWLFKSSFTKKFAVLIYLWSYFDYVWYNDEIDLVLTSWGSRNRASPPIHKTFFYSTPSTEGVLSTRGNSVCLFVRHHFFFSNIW